MSTPDPIDPLLLYGSIAGLVGGLAGLGSLAWTVIWSLTLRPRVRWSLNRFDEMYLNYPRLPNGEPTPNGTRWISHDPHMLRFYFRNTGGLAADEAHATLIGSNWTRTSKVEFPANGRLRVEPGGEIFVRLQAKNLDGELAGRPYLHGHDNVFDLRGVVVEIRWRRQTFGFAKRRFNLWNDQKKVPFVPPDGGVA